MNNNDNNNINASINNDINDNNINNTDTDSNINNIKNNEIELKIKDVLNKIRPFLNNDGGDVEYIKFENGIVYVKLLGSCQDCPVADNTINDMLEYTLTFEIPEVTRVVNVIDI
ncbi:MAG: NifU family protein [Bacilli bacterium]